MELVSSDGELLVGECVLERRGLRDKRSFPSWVNDYYFQFGETFVEDGVFLYLHLLVFASCVSLVI